MLAQAAREAGGRLEVESEPGQGTTVRALFQRNHPDRKPLGDIAVTLKTILLGRPELDLRFEHWNDGELVARFASRSETRNAPPKDPTGREAKR